MKEKSANRKGFKVPEDYFESFDSKLMTRVKEGSKNGLKVPEGYFDTFEVKPSNPSENSKETGSKGVFNLKRPEIKKLAWMAAAASILLFFGVKYTNTNQSPLEWEDLEHAEISSWIESDLVELNALDIAEAYPDVELNGSVINNEDLNAYLNEIDLDQILYEN